MRAGRAAPDIEIKSFNQDSAVILRHFQSLNGLVSPDSMYIFLNTNSLVSFEILQAAPP